MTEYNSYAGKLLSWQQDQFRHDIRNHSDIITLARVDRLKHYGLHFAKYAGRIARDSGSEIVSKTTVDALLVCLSAANALSQKLDQNFDATSALSFRMDMLTDLTDAAGRFCDACEKIDHLEDFLSIAHTANIDILAWILCVATSTGLPLEQLLAARRRQLADRQFLLPRDA